MRVMCPRINPKTTSYYFGSMDMLIHHLVLPVEMAIRFAGDASLTFPAHTASYEHWQTSLTDLFPASIERIVDMLIFRRASTPLDFCVHNFVGRLLTVSILAPHPELKFCIWMSHQLEGKHHKSSMSLDTWRTMRSIQAAYWRALVIRKFWQ